MVEVTPLRAHDADHAIHTITLPVRAFGSGAARFFAVVEEASTAPPRGASRRAGSIATMMENLAGDDDLPRTPAAWFSAYIARLQERVRDRHDTAPNAVSVGMGIAYPEQDRIAVTLARSGAVGAFLIARHARERAVAVDVLAPTGAAGSIRFEHAVDGVIHAEDLLIVGTPALVERAARTAVIQACARLTPNDAVAAIARAVLHDHPSAQGLIVSGSASSSRPRSQRSMDTFLATATSTEHFLTPRLGPVLRQYAVQLRSTTSFFVQRRHRRAPGNRFLLFVQHAMQLALRTVVLGIRSAGALALDGLRIVGIAIVRAVRAIHRIRTRIPAVAKHADESISPPLSEGEQEGVRHRSDVSRPERREVGWGSRERGFRGLLHRVRTTSAASMNQGRSWYASLPKTSQRLFSLTVTFALLFLISTGGLWRRRLSELNISAYNATLATIEELRSVAEARLLFSDRTTAREALREAEAKLATLPRTSRARRERAAVLEGEIRASLDRARLLTRLHAPLRVGRGGEGGIPFTEVGGVSVVGQRLTAIAADGSAIATIDPRDGAVTPHSFTAPQLPSRPLRALALDDRSILLIDAGAHVARINVRAGSVTAMTIEQPPPEIRDAALFQGRLYLLHADGQITRHVRTTGGFSRGTVWLRAGDAPSGARRLIVVGPVVLSSDDGSLAVYFAGRKRDTDLRKGVDPPLATAALLTAPPEGDLLYLGDPAEGRVVALRMNGELIGQVQSDAFRAMRDLAVDPAGAALYVLTNNEISVVIPPKKSSN